MSVLNDKAHSISNVIGYSSQISINNGILSKSAVFCCIASIFDKVKKPIKHEVFAQIKKNKIY